MRTAGLHGVLVEEVEVGSNLGTDGFMWFFWESGNHTPMKWRANFGDDADAVKAEMRRLLDEEYEGGWKVPLRVAVGVGWG